MGQREGRGRRQGYSNPQSFSKRTPGLMINYRSEQDFIGQDNMKIFLIFPDGSGAKWDYMLIVK
jgi:hypothetical protein